MTYLLKQLRKKLISAAFNNNVLHIPSALSMVDYFYWINKKINYTKDCLVIGKPYGLLAYSVVWNINNYAPISNKTKNVIWCDYTLGNCLGVAVGLALSNKYRNIYVNISDGSLQEGTVLEALAFIGNMKYSQLSKIILLVDYNNYLCISKTLISIETFNKVLKNFGWNVKKINGHNEYNLKKLLTIDITTKPTCFLFSTIKGFGINFIQNNPLIWHYKKLDKITYDLAIKQL